MNNLLDRLSNNIREISATVFNQTIAPGQIVDPDSFKDQDETYKRLLDSLCLHVAFTTFNHHGYKDYGNTILKPIIIDEAARALHRISLFKNFYDFDMECATYREKALLQAELILDVAHKYLMAEGLQCECSGDTSMGWFKRFILKNDKCI